MNYSSSFLDLLSEGATVNLPSGFFSHGQMEFIMAKPRTLWRHNWISAFAGLFLLSGGTAQPCPPMCQFCSADRTECEQVSSLQAVLIGLPNFTEKIVLRRGNLSEIPPLSFQKFPNLQFLSITGFPVSSLMDLTFSPVHANSLRSLDLSNNHLLSCSVEPMAFSGLVTLEELALNNNSLDILQSPWFLGLMALSKLSLALNRISYLPPRMFENLAKLEELVISSNQIQYLSIDTFYGLASLTRLDLSSNKLVFINNEAFQPLQALRHLLLSENRLTALPFLPSSITFLFLHANPWDCSCQLVDSVKSWADRIQKSPLLVCNTPPSLAGRQVISAGLEDCSFSSSRSNPHLPPQTVLNPSLLYGFLGGVLLGCLVCLIICCCLKLRKSPSVTGEAESKKIFQSESTNVFLGKVTATRADLQSLGGFPVTERTTIGLEPLAKGPHNHSCEASRTHNVEQMRSPVERPLLALLSVDKITNKTVVTLCEKGSDTAGSRDEWIHSPNRPPRFLGDAGQQHFVHGEHKFCGSPFQHATSNQTGRTEYVFPRVGLGAETQLDGLTSKSDADQPPHPSIHEDFPAGNATKVQREGAVGPTASPQRDKSSGSGSHINASHHRSEMEEKTFSPAYSHPPGFASPSYAKTSEVRCWEDEGFMERRNGKSRARSVESPRKAGIGSKAYRLRLSRSSRKLLHNLDCIPSYEATPASSLSSSSNSYYVALQPRKHTRLSLRLSAVPQRRKMSLEQKQPRRQQTDPRVATARCASTAEKHWECPACGCEESHPRSVAQRGLAQPAGAVSSKGLLGAASQPFSSNTASCQDHATAQPLLGSQQNAKNLPVEGLPESTPPTALPHPQLPFRVPHGGPDEDKVEPIYEYSQLLCAKSTPGTELAQQAPGVAFPVAEKTVTQVIIKEEGGKGVVHTVTEVGSMTVHSIKKKANIRSLGEEMYNAQEEVEALACAFNQCLAAEEKTLVNASSEMAQLSSCLAGGSSSEMSFGGPEEPKLWEANNRSNNEIGFSEAEEPKLWEATNVSSECPLVERMFQTDFPLLEEE